MSRISFFSFDLGPAKNLILVAQEALARGHGVRFIGNSRLGQSKPDMNEYNILVTGLSSHQNEEELLMGQEALGRDIPWIILADTHRAWGRAAAKGRVGSAIAIVASPSEIALAKNFGYKDALFLGGPPLWKEFANIRPIEIERRGKEKIILVGGIKDAMISNALLEAVVASMEKIGIRWRLIFKSHINENRDGAEMLRRQKILKRVDVLTSSEDIDRLMGGSDLSIHTSGATSIISAAFQRLPVIWYEDELVRQRLLEATGYAEWFPAEVGACSRATAEMLPGEIAKLLFDERYKEKLKKRQEEIYPAIDQENKPERSIVDFIEGLV